VIKKVRFIYLSFALSFIVIIVIAILYSAEFSSLRRINTLLEHTHEVRIQILKVQSNLIQAENIQRGYLLTKDKALLPQLAQTNKDTYKNIEYLHELTKDNSNQQMIIARLKEIVSSRFKVLYEAIEGTSGNDNNTFPENTKKGELVMQNILALSKRLDETEAGLLEKRQVEKRFQEIATSRYLKLILLVSILFQTGSFIIITRAFKRRKTYQKILENNIKELNASHSEMEQIAFVASHDLQEPLRKIRIYSDKLMKDHKAKLDDHAQLTLEKIAFSSKRMQELLTDFINYTLLLKTKEELHQVDLNQCLDAAIAEYKETIHAKKATIDAAKLPLIEGNSQQLQLLFSHLLDNALKFSKPDVPPHIKITVTDTHETKNEEIKNYYKISFNDNGIGFERELSSKIFIIFQRLHSNSSYTGKGIGLAICKRIMINHNGYISAESTQGEGATFNLFFVKE